MIKSIVSRRCSWRPKALPTRVLHGLSDLQHLTALHCSGVASCRDFAPCAAFFVPKILLLPLQGEKALALVCRMKVD